MNKKQLPIGIEDFETVARDCYYVDKTLLIKEIMDRPAGNVFLITRPRRFGKSLTLSMLESFFDEKKDSRDLFLDKKIAGCGSRYMSSLNSAPVIHLNFKNLSSLDFPSLSILFKDLIRSAYGKEADIATSDKLNVVERQYFRSVLDGSLPMASYASSIGNLVKMLYEAYGTKPILLIDEYDTPILSSRNGHYYDEAIEFYRNALGSALKGNAALGAGVVTGVMRIAKESIFSGINNLRSSSSLDSSFGEYFGFTEEETRSLLDYYGGASHYYDVKAWYDGYKYGDVSVFNPWSVLLYIDEKFVPGLYWSNTSSNSLLQEIVTPETAPFFSELLSGDDAEQRVDDAIPFASLGSDLSSISSVLLASGYLTIQKKIGDRRFSLRIPNKEVHMLFRDEIVDRYIPKLPVITLQSQLLNALRGGHPQEFSELIESSFLQCFSYFDFSDEKNYQILVLVVCAFLFGGNRVRSEVNAGEGRCDIMVYPSKNDGFASAIEIKFSKGRLSEAQLSERCKNALSKIEKNKNVSGLRWLGKPVYIFGIAFSGSRAKTLMKKIEG